MFDKVIVAADFAIRIYMRLQSRVSPNKLGNTFFGAKMYCDIKDFIQRRVYYFNMFEPNLSYYILGQARSGDHVVDVGANVGYITLLFSSIVGNSGNVVAIEASPANYAALRKNLELNKIENVTAINMAATNGPCVVEILAGEKNNSGTNAIRQDAGTGAVTVRGDALSNTSEIRHDKVSFIKIDVEGSEAPIMRDIIDTINLYPSLRTIAVELTPGSSYLMAELQKLGFHAYAFPNNYTIGYLIVRKYLRRSDEEGFVVKLPKDAYDPNYRDYIFERA